VGYIGSVLWSVVLIIIVNGFSSIIGFFYIDVFPIIEVGTAQAFAVIKATTDSEDLEAITDILCDVLIRTDTWMGMER